MLRGPLITGITEPSFIPGSNFIQLPNAQKINKHNMILLTRKKGDQSKYLVVCSAFNWLPSYFLDKRYILLRPLSEYQTLDSL